MECERLIKLVKNWYLQVKDEALAPARMVAFMKKHVDECPVCMVDDGVAQEVDRISRIILPPTKVPKPSKDEDDEQDEDIADDDEQGEEDTDDTDDSDDDTDDEEELEVDDVDDDMDDDDD